MLELLTVSGTSGSIFSFVVHVERKQAFSAEVHVLVRGDVEIVCIDSSFTGAIAFHRSFLVWVP